MTPVTTLMARMRATTRSTARRGRQAEGEEEGDDEELVSEKDKAPSVAASSREVRTVSGYDEEDLSESTWFDKEIRGYKLLKWSGLDTAEKNAVLAATQNQVTLDLIANALRTQYENDNELARRDRVKGMGAAGSRDHQRAAMAATVHEEYDDAWQEPYDHWDDSNTAYWQANEWYDDGWDEHQADDADYDGYGAASIALVADTNDEEMKKLQSIFS